MMDTDRDGLRFTRIHIRNWRNFLDAELELQARMFIVGPNAAGKSNLLDVFRFVHEIATPVGGGLQSAVDRRGGVGSVRALSARRTPQISIEISVGTDDSPRLWEYELQFDESDDAQAVVTRERISHNGTVIRERPEPDDLTDRQRLTQTYLEQMIVNAPFRELARFLDSVRYLHIVPQLVRDRERSVGKKNDPFGGDFIEQVALLPEKRRRARLRRVKDVLKVAVPQLVDLQLGQDKTGAFHLKGKYEHWRPRGAWQLEDQFSDGTLRLLGLLWVLQDEEGPLLLEEPELSLHAEVVRYIPQMFARVQLEKNRQIIVSTHSAEMLRDNGVGLDEVVLLTPMKEGTSVSLARDIAQVDALLKGGIDLAELVMEQTRPKDAAQLSLAEFNGEE